MGGQAGEYNSGVWSAEEHEAFLLAVKDFISWKEVARRVGTRSITQCRSHDQKHKKKEHNRKEGRGRAPRMEHRLLGDHETQGMTPTSPTSVDERVAPSCLAVVNSSALDIQMGIPEPWGVFPIPIPIPVATGQECPSVADSLSFDVSTGQAGDVPSLDDFLPEPADPDSWLAAFLTPDDST